MKFLIDKDNAGKRIDIYLSRNIKNISRSYIKKLIENKLVKINQNVINSPSIKIKNNDKVSLKIIKEKKDYLYPKNMKLDIVYEDNDILIINKPKGMVVHPGAGNYNDTLANGLAYKFKNKLSNLGGYLRPGIVHRIDKETSGLLVVAKNNISHSLLGKQFNDHTIKRKYQCLVWGVVRPLNGRIETLITRCKKNRQLMSVSEINGKKAITNYKTLKVYNIKDVPKISLLECQLETGRTHQIRVHLKFKGASLLGDKQYGKKNIKFKKVNEQFLKKLENLKGQALHAKTLEFFHPAKRKIVFFNSNLPKDFQKILDLLDNPGS